MTNVGTTAAVLDTLSFNIGPQGGAGHEFSVTILGESYTGSDTDIDVPATLQLGPGQSTVADVTFAVTEHMLNDVQVVFHGNFEPVTLALAGFGGGVGNPFLHVVINESPVTVDYDGSGEEEVALDGSFSHTHEPGHVIEGYAWAEGAVPLGTAPVLTPSFALGTHTVNLTITDDNAPPMSLAGAASFKVVSPASVPGVLALYYAAGSPLTLLDNVPALASFAEIRDQMLVTDQGAIGGTPYSENVMLRLQANVTLAVAGTVTFSALGGSDRRLFVDGSSVNGPLSLPAGNHAVEARFAVISLPDLPAEVLMDAGAGPLPIGIALLTHNEVAQKPVLNSMPSQGITFGGNAIEIAGLGFFPSGGVTVHWGATNLTAVDFTAESPTSIQFLSPAHASGLISVTVQTPQGTSNALPFEYVADGTPPINFNELLPTLSIPKPTCGAWGPDGRFYVGTVNGRIFAITFDDNYVATNVTNYVGISPLDNDDILGIAFDPYDPPSPVRLYIAHSQIYSKGGGPFAGPFPYIGRVSVLTGPNFNGATPFITGLPTSNHDHAINGMQFDNNGDLLIAVGGNTNAGVKYPSIGDLPESALTAAVLKAETSRPDFNGAVTYVTTATGVPNDDQVLGELSDIAPGSHVHVQSAGVRNAFDIAYTTRKLLYATDNGPNTSFGPASTGAGTQGGEPSQPDELLLLEYGNYYGAANRARGRADARQNIYRDTTIASIPDQFSQAMLTFSSGTGGLCEYRADTFLGQMRGNLLVQKWNSTTRRVVLSTDGRSVVSSQTFGPNMSPLDIEIGPGGVLLAPDYTTDELHVALPADLAATGLSV
ncbi:MAG TPA: IPT/TIG domain-containing protein, partial [Planctomycetota bacterium]|nr:IPT/TIG domain-containing protein [Planctomycetota bacterium]